ncbi:MAG: acetyl-CoA carboxylase biotin carboxyl carrier protein [Alicyclobacillus sp.]|nr:acetyl-CoA carboxylase biotin carboxyl carrier protein [Alicyclobacillus sp.]
MFKIGEIRELIRLLDETSVQELLVEMGDAKLSIKKTGPVAAPAVPAPASVTVAEPAAAVAPAPAPAVATSPTPSAAPSAPANSADESDIEVVASPMVGTFYRAPSPDAPPYVEIGTRVNEKTVVCIVEAMKLMNEIEAETSGVIVDILAENGQLVEYGQPLFKIRRS